MMDLDEAIQHCEEVAKEQDNLCKRYDDASKYSRSHNKDIVSANAKKCLECFECAKEHRQLAEWLKELKDYRKTWDEIKKQIKEESNFAYADFDEYKYEVLGVDDIDELPDDDFRYGMQRALEIINEYIREVKENG